MDLKRKTHFVSIAIVVATLIFTVVLYVLYNVAFLLIIVAPPLIYEYLRRRQRDGESSLNGNRHV